MHFHSVHKPLHTFCGRGAGVGEELCSRREDRSRPRPVLVGGRGTWGVITGPDALSECPVPCCAAASAACINSVPSDNCQVPHNKLHHVIDGAEPSMQLTQPGLSVS